MCDCVKRKINSQAAGMAIAQALDFEIDSAKNPTSRSAAWFFIIILKFIFTAIFEIKNHVKNFLAPKKFHKDHSRAEKIEIFIRIEIFISIEIFIRIEIIY